MLIFAYIILIISLGCWIRSVYLCVKKHHSTYPMWIAYAFILIANLMIEVYK